MILKADLIMSKDIPKIPQNKSNFFKFIINKDRFFIDIQFEHNQKIDYENLFLILKSYIINEPYFINFIFINSSENIEEVKNFKINLYHNVSVKKIEKIKYIDFKDWFDEFKERDFEYIKNLKFYGFRIVIDKKSPIWENLNFYPLYPWNKNFKKIFIKKNKIDFQKWLFIKNKNLYKNWILINKGRVNK